MRLISILILGTLLSPVGRTEALPEKAITLINAAAVDAPLLERLRCFAKRELHIPVRTTEHPELTEQKTVTDLKKAAQRLKTDADITLIILARMDNEPQHLAVDSTAGIALINAQALHTDDAEKFARRIERQIMRAAAFSFGLEPTPDPFCVTRDYNTVEELDTMGRNYSPPWQGRYAEEAQKRGLVLAPLGE